MQRAIAPSTLEKQFSRWAKPPSRTERERCENAIRAVRNAIAGSDALRKRQLKVFLQGSYRNRVNVRQDSDVDVGILCYDTFIPSYPPGTDHATFGVSPATYHYHQYKHDIHMALAAHFGSNAVRRGNKAFDIQQNSYRVEADVAPFFEHRHYWMNQSAWGYWGGVVLKPGSGGFIYNYPERLLETWPDLKLHYESGVSKNKTTHLRFKGGVRILKKLRNQMDEAGILAARPVPGFLVECLVFNTPNSCFDHRTWYERVWAILHHLYWSTVSNQGTPDWYEVNGVKLLFAPTQPWTKQIAHEFVYAAQDYLGMPRL